ncbi:eukaryotic translation elongation factor 1 delta a (guanine nucleotide exchange protein) isoform X5 [Betta splendens]|uniref:Eukaryotic translation elongation factor 1 delta a (Guanine nucleotide exchange protein) isoform X5 n=1 Tax=Betta splendens TaxID=158456 RepID=A0A6P7KVW0_BETSP|nr:eukaryotic translation elongation factor 1 delta a (guanine nucleotide exchange protein) isoform X5 [Betta splendens]
MDQPLTNQQHKGSVPVGQGSIGAQERGIISGDNVQFGRLRRRTRLSQSESQSSGPEEEQVSSSVDARRSGRAHNPQQDQEPPPAPAKPSACTGLQNKKSRNRTSSETEGGKGGSRGPMQRKRGHSETENRPRPDKPDMSGLQCLASEKVWFDKHRYDEAERRLYEGANGPATQQSSSNAGDQELVSRMKSLELENQTLHKVVVEMKAALQRLESRVAVLEKSPAPAAVQCAKTAPVRQVKVENGGDEDDDDDIDLFGSDDDDEEAERLKQERLDAYAAKKAKKPALIAKSSILLDVKPWDDETDMAKLEECVRSVQMDGLLWGASKLLPVGYGIKKLQISCVVEDDKVGTDILEEEITKFEDFVQSVDVAAFNKI